jgi:hypothetical protein
MDRTGKQDQEIRMYTLHISMVQNIKFCSFQILKIYKELVVQEVTLTDFLWSVIG